jgi:hypothetical protein
VGKSVLVRNYRGNNKWKSGIVQRKTVPVSYMVETSPGQAWRRHTDQIISSVPQQDSDIPEVTSTLGDLVMKPAECPLPGHTRSRKLSCNPESSADQSGFIDASCT